MGNVLRSRVASIALVWLVTLAATLGKFDNGFVTDDRAVIESPLIRDPSHIPGLFFHHATYLTRESQVTALDTYRPVTLLSFFWDAWLSGLQPISYHVTNTAMHLLCVALVYALCRALVSARARPYATLGALFFALSPQLGEAHVWINGRSDLFCTAFGLAALLVWRRALTTPAQRTRIALHGAAFLLMLLGLLSKETLLMVLPAALLWPSPAPRPLRLRLAQALPVVLPAVPYLWLRARALHGLRAAILTACSARCASCRCFSAMACASCWRPASCTCAASTTSIAGSAPRSVALAALLLVGLALWAFRQRRERALVLWGLLWFGLTLAPASLIYMPTWPGFGRYLYLPCAGLCPALTEHGVELALWLSAHVRRAAVRVFAAVCLALYFAMLAAQLAGVSADYQSPRTLYAAALAVRPDAAHANEGLGLALFQEGRPDLAVPLLERASALAATSPRYVHVLFDAYMRTQEVAKAQSLLERSIARAPLAQCGDLRAALVYTTHLKDAERTSSILAECLQYQPDLADCRAWIPRLIAPEHPLSARYRARFQELARDHHAASTRAALRQLLAAAP